MVLALIVSKLCIYITNFDQIDQILANFRAHRPYTNSIKVMQIWSILTKLIQFWPILEALGPILGQIITLGVWNCHNRAQRGWKWGYRTKNNDHIINSSQLVPKISVFDPKMTHFQKPLGGVAENSEISIFFATLDFSRGRWYFLAPTILGTSKIVIFTPFLLYPN